jgi:hypothetical protein
MRYGRCGDGPYTLYAMGRFVLISKRYYCVAARLRPAGLSNRNSNHPSRDLY